MAERRRSRTASPVAWACALALLSLLTTVRAASAYHDGPTVAEVLGWDRAAARIYFAQFDESEVALAPALWFFDLRAADPERAVRVAGPRYPSDDGAEAFEARIDSLRRVLARPHALSGVRFLVTRRSRSLPDTLLEDRPTRFERFAWSAEVSGLGRSGHVSGLSYCDDVVEAIRPVCWRGDEPIVVTVRHRGVLIGGCNDLETCALLLPAKRGRP